MGDLLLILQIALLLLPLMFLYLIAGHLKSIDESMDEVVRILREGDERARSHESRD